MMEGSCGNCKDMISIQVFIRLVLLDDEVFARVWVCHGSHFRHHDSFGGHVCVVGVPFEVSAPVYYFSCGRKNNNNNNNNNNSEITQIYMMY